MKGRQILIEPRGDGGSAAALMIDGQLEDLLVDPLPGDPIPQPEAIYLAAIARPMTSLGAAIVDLGGGCTGFLRMPGPPAPGARLLVQVAGWAEPEKAPPVSARLRLKGRSAILTPGAPGQNISRSITEADARAALARLAAAAMAGAPPDLGLILRTAAADADPEATGAEIASLRGAYGVILSRMEAGQPRCLLAAPGAAATARRDWQKTPQDPVIEGPGAFATQEVWETVAELHRPRVPLDTGHMMIEPTHALTAVDVNTGSDVSPAAALKVNLAAARALPRQLRLRGIGGQITIDLAPLAKANRGQVERALAAALKSDGIVTTLAGWTPLGHLELVRKRSRRPLSR